LTFSATVLVMAWVATLAFFQNMAADEKASDPVVGVGTGTQTSMPAEPLDCVGGTGSMGCGAGWFWRDGWRGWACYPC